MVSLSPRLRDSLDYEDPDTHDPRLSWGFRSLSLQDDGYDGDDYLDDHRPYSPSSDPRSRRQNKQRRTDTDLGHVQPFSYQTVADGDLFRLAVIYPGAGPQPIECRLIWESSRAPVRQYQCLSYCWQTTHREKAIFVDGFRFPVTRNLFGALRSLRKPNTTILIWIDQLCINQDDDIERARQVSIMKNIFSCARQVIVWLGEEGDRSREAFEFVKKMTRGDDSPRGALQRKSKQRQLQAAIQSLLERPWFHRVWVIPEVCLAKKLKIVCGPSTMSWENLVRLLRDVHSPATGFEKQSMLPGNTRQRVAILSQMLCRQKENIPHVDISQLLILAKASQATERMDKVYAFYGMTLVSTQPDYSRSVESLYMEIAQIYVNSIEACYAGWNDLNESQRTFQLMSILYSAGSLHQRLTLPSWVPDWTFPWHLAPIWCRTNADFSSDASKVDKVSDSRSEYRAGGSDREHFEIEANSLHLRLSAILLDIVTITSETTPASTPATDGHSPIPLSSASDSLQATNNLRYGRTYFKTQKEGFVGVATPGIEVGDVLAILLGGDVPVVLRANAPATSGRKEFRLLCECFVESHAVMTGETSRWKWPQAEVIVLV